MQQPPQQLREQQHRSPLKRNVASAFVGLEQGRLPLRSTEAQLPGCAEVQTSSAKGKA
jgi:hypothetical protein